MLKIFKYEMIHSFRSYLLIFIIFLLCCFIIPWMPNGVKIVGGGIFTLLTIGILLGIFYGILYNYNHSMFKKPGYLTLTLPVSSHQLIWGKVLSTFVWILLAGCILFIGYVVVYYQMIYAIMDGGPGIPTLLELLQGIWSSFASMNAFEFIKEGLIIILSIISLILGCYCLVTIVQTKYTRRHKVVWMIVIFIGYWVLWSLIQNLIPQEANESLIKAVMDTSQIDILITAIQTIAYYFITVYILDNQLEME